MGTRSINRLSALRFAGLTKTGRHCDGGGLYLQIGENGTRSWIFRFQINGRVRDMGLGSAKIIGLSDARDFAAKCRIQVAQGLDPLEERLRRQQEQVLEAANAVTFEKCARAFIEAKRPSWRNRKHAEQWERSLETYTFPIIGHLPVKAISTSLVLKVLEPIWTTKYRTASRLRERIENVLDAAKARGLRNEENPARWRGHLQNLLAKPVITVRHHPALPFNEIGTFLFELKAHQSTAARAMELLILTATRANEVLGSRWDEINLTNAVWTVPGSRTKTGKNHRIPLSVTAAALLKHQHDRRDGEFVFPGRTKDGALCHMTFSKLLRKLGRPDITAHGFRSSFRDWAAERTNFSPEVVEMALAHAVENRVEAAYRRGDLLEKRLALMNAWAGYCARPATTAKVLELSISQGMGCENKIPVQR